MKSDRDGPKSSREARPADSQGEATTEFEPHRDSRTGESDIAAKPVQAGDGEPTGPIPEMVRKALAGGLAGFFSTEQTIRRALGDTLPREWVDFVSSQSERTRGDLTDAIAQEVGRTLKSIDLTQVADQLLTGRTLEVSARVRLLPLDDDNDHSHDGDEPEENDT